MSKSLSTLLLDTRELRAGSVITESEINALKLRWRPMGRMAGVAQEECNKFMAHAPYHISREQAEKGFAWWRAQCFTPKGKRRDTEFTRNMDETAWEVVAEAARFELVDWHWEPNGMYSMYWPFPVYRMLTNTGKSFDYVARAWQSGGALIL